MKHIHGGNIYPYETILDFSANLNPLGMPEAVRAAAIQGIEAAEHYPDPDCTALREALAQAEGVQKKQLICGNGAAELIFLLASARRPGQALLVAPSFAEYGQALQAVGCRIKTHRLDASRGFRLEADYLDVLTPDLDMAFLCNPNNPTGLLSSRGFLEEILLKCRENGILLVIDECFLALTGVEDAFTLKGLLGDGGLFILKAFTKLYAMAGLRLGYGITGDVSLLEQMNGCRQPWSVSVPAQAAGTAALKETDYVKQSVAYVEKERNWLFQKLSNFPFCVFPGTANYLFFRADRQDLSRQLLHCGILIRDCSNYPGLSAGYYRIAVRTHEENEKLIFELNRLYGNGQS